MNAVNPYLKQYRKNEIETATPEKVLLLLYDGAINFLNKAKTAIEEGRNEQVTPNIYSCQKIILEFMNTLDMERGGSLAENLYKVYENFYKTLVDAGFSQDIRKIDEILKHLKNLRETWQKAISMANSEKENNFMDKYEKHDDDEDEDEDDDEDDEEDEA